MTSKIVGISLKGLDSITRIHGILFIQNVIIAILQKAYNKVIRNKCIRIIIIITYLTLCK